MGYSFADFVNDPATAHLIYISLVTLPLCFIVTGLRLIASQRSTRKLGWDDAFAVLALIGFFGYAICPFIVIGLAGDLDEEGLAILSAKVSYIGAPFFYVNQLFSRGSLFILYYRIFWVDQTFVRWIYTLATIHVCWFITFLFLLLFLCTPISKWWDIYDVQPGHCIDGNTFLVPEEMINSSLDIAMMILSVGAVQKLITRKHMKTKLAFIFVVGGLSGVIGFVKIGIVYGTANDNGQENNTNAFWDILQMATSMWCACAPMYKVLLPLGSALGSVWIRLKSVISNHGGDSRSSVRMSDFRISIQGGSSRDKKGEDGNEATGTPARWSRLAEDSRKGYKASNQTHNL
ncbi:hypothetical protein K505DRAFT_374217 [Melanomma pulvis-pyrius CBS 109.77]|uniref:Rhodopsin domain-containing protein n=1 Tax=Melanomma pulvis-pyrius CBS 109.77 TaxID=1314802 RepID=A0A6A6XEZ1_9PLEO|nr:hypothetical protein K505DRAFT_374217 [Melanomma pulvis-pyrius CBS 109.77]